MSELLDLCSAVVSWAGPGEQVEAFASRRRSTSVRVYEREVESFTSAEPSGVGIRVVADGRQGFASAGSLDLAVLKETLEEARDNARFAEADEHAGLAVPDGLPRPELGGLFRPAAASMPAEEKIAAALELERLAESKDPRVKVRNAAWSDAVGEQAIATTTGISSWGRLSTVSVSVVAMAEADGRMQVAGGVSYGRSPDELDLELAADEGVGEAVRMLGATKPRSAKLTVVLMPRVTLQFIDLVGTMLSGEASLKGRTPFADRLGETIAAQAVTLVDDPTDPRSLSAWADDDEGVTSRRNVLVDGGVLATFLYDTYAARRAGTASTASAVRTYSSTPAARTRALRLVGGTGSQEDVLSAVGTGVLVQSVTGLHSGVNAVSGDFSAGAAGLMIRDGALAEPVQEMTIGSTLQRMLQDVVVIGGDERWFGSSAGVSVAIADVALGGA